MARRQLLNKSVLTPDECLLLGAETGNIELIKRALNDGAYLYSRKKEDSRIYDGRHKISHKDDNALTISVKNDHIPCVEYLLQQGFHPNSWVEYQFNPKDRITCSALSLAVSRKNEAAAKLLIRYGADVNFRIDCKGTTAMSQLLYTGDAEDLQMLEFLVKNGGNINQRNMKGNTVLMTLAMQGGRKGVMDIVRYLVEQGADLSIKNRKRQTVFDIAVFFENHEVLSFLNAYQDERSLAISIESDRQTFQGLEF